MSEPPRARPYRPAMALAAGGVATQLAYPLVTGGTRAALTVLIVVLLAGASVAHAAGTRGVRVAGRVLAATAATGFAAEVVGVHTGAPFGRYVYGDGLGPRLFDVPLVIALAWTMLAYPAALAARRLARGHAARVALGAWALAVTDLFLDPQMTAAGYWRWTGGGPHLPGTAVPLTNFAGWLAVSLVLSLLLQAVLPDRADDRLPLALYLWLFAGWTVALAVFEQRPEAAGWGALGMGSVALPLLVALRCHPRSPAPLGPAAAVGSAGRAAAGPGGQERRPALRR